MNQSTIRVYLPRAENNKKKRGRPVWDIVACACILPGHHISHLTSTRTRLELLLILGTGKERREGLFVGQKGKAKTEKNIGFAHS